MIRIPLDQSDQVHDHDIDSPRLIKLPKLGSTINFRPNSIQQKFISMVFRT